MMLRNQEIKTYLLKSNCLLLLVYMVSFFLNNCLFTLFKAMFTHCLIPYSSPIATNFPLFVKKFALHLNKGMPLNFISLCSNIRLKFPLFTILLCFSRKLSTQFLTASLSYWFKVSSLPVNCIDRFAI